MTDSQSQDWYDSTEKDLRLLLQSLDESMSHAAMEEVETFLYHGEYGIALELMGNCISGSGQEIGLSVFSTIERLAKRMEIEDSVLTVALRGCVVRET